MSDTKDKIVANISKSINLPDSFKMALDDVKGMSKMNQILIGNSSSSKRLKFIFYFIYQADQVD